MITQEQIPAVLEHPVFDAEGSKIGDANHVFFDDATGRPEWVSIKTGFFGTSESFVPIRDAVMVEDHLEVPYSKGKVKDAPNVDVDSGGHLSESEEVRLYEYYGMAWDDAWQQANQPGEKGWARSETGTTGVAGTRSMEAGTAAMGTGTDRGADMRGTEDGAMTRSEEHMHVGAERYETGRARLRKYVVTEEVQQTVPLRHEEVRLEREPITDANRGDAMAGPEISEAEHEVTLHAERPVVQTETVPVERVRLSTEEVAEEETVTGEVRKERIAAEGVEDDEGGRPRP
ncbi:uncharacterized protein (TIGR02271 family) [Streptomyces sp. V3I8]|jgi:uncharacterized protein (TIGR02271 family)|uniref:PRC and DUF2382 domain-containing protein n=1 Tax=Streptomyces sp. V3I8 TaxID=3042279 RepID=UPI002787C630|nr:PRC and DUF2382 domain-containing protein [Streptomyces sp. V3I8]MDQ1035413.1 uncharacterized protein (TIGR02271 family) [Streptomyces sp. V3I8]